ncbi:MAG TPA: hypothetical protein VFN48_11710 [Solirubrobacteraceae bacterium]|nr:hypothetical protein [Solirubrobacteraceae bacterium]
MASSTRSVLYVAGATLGGAAGVVALRTRRPRRHLPGQVELVRAPHATVIGANGAVRSKQTARLALPVAELERLWTPPNLENLGATYWHFLTYVTLGTVRVLYSETDRRITLLGLPWLTLLRFDPPDFEMRSDHARISWQIKDGLLVASQGRAQGGLALEVVREPDAQREGADTEAEERAELTIEVEVTNFYPSIASWLGDFVYRSTQAFIHMLVGNAFLRSLGSLELRQSKIGRLLTGSTEPPV